MPTTFFTAAKADGVTDDAEIHIKKPLPEFADMDEANCYYQTQAAQLYDVLKNHLPKATRLQLIILMLQEVTYLYRGI